mgnify:CR=1 FL=1
MYFKSTIIEIGSKCTETWTVCLCNLGVLQWFAKCGNWSEFLPICWKSFFWMSTYSLTEHNFIDASSLWKIFFQFWLETIVFQSPCSWIQFVIFRLDDFPLFNNSIIHIWIKMIPFVNVFLLSFLKLKFICWCQKWILLWFVSCLLLIWCIQKGSVSIATWWADINDIICWNCKGCRLRWIEIAETFVFSVILSFDIESFENCSGCVSNSIIIVIDLFHLMIWWIPLNEVHTLINFCRWLVCFMIKVFFQFLLIVKDVTWLPSIIVWPFSIWWLSDLKWFLNLKGMGSLICFTSTWFNAKVCECVSHCLSWRFEC